MTNKTYSFKNFMDQDLRGHDPKGFAGEIVGTCFAQQERPGELPPYDVFPAGVTGVTFVRCNLDNVRVPDGCTVEKGTNKVIRVMNDLDDWRCNEKGEPIEPMNKAERLRVGISCDPKDIPKDFIREEVIDKAEFDRLKTDPDFLQWWDEAPLIVDGQTRDVVFQVPKTDWDRNTIQAAVLGRFDDAHKTAVATVSRTVLDDGELKSVQDVQVSGKVTTYRIRGKGKVRLSGVKWRPYVNESLFIAVQREREAYGD